jgi:DNA-binding NarL/FixJ family response regulator
MAEIVGRDRELRIGEAFVRDLAAGPALLRIEGEAGIGKSTLWEAIAELASAAGLTVLRAQPTAAETALTFSALADLLGTVPDAELEPLPAVQRRAMEVALFRAEPPERPVEPGVVAAATRSLLRSLARSAPVVVAIDDEQWVDRATALALGHALRRLGDARIGMLFARRSDEESPFDLGALPASVTRHELVLAPLSLAATHHVLKDRLGSAVPRSTLVRIHEASGGYPLFALEIGRLLADPTVARVDDEPLPIPGTVRELVRHRVHALPASTRATLVAAAAHSDPRVSSVSAAVGHDILEDMAIARREQVARIDGDRIVFTHPLFAAAIYAETPSADRLALHRRLAEVVDDPEERARHRSLGTVGPDEAVAAELQAAAARATARAAPLAAAELLQNALRMTPPEDGAAIDAQTLALGRALVLGGDLTDAASVLEQAVRTGRSPQARARARLVLARVVFELDPGPRCAHLAEQALEDAEGDLALVTEAHATLAAVDYDDWRRAAHHAEEAMRLLPEVPDPSPSLESAVLFAVAGNRIRDGSPVPMDIVERALALERIEPAPVVSDRMSANLGYWLFLAGDDVEEGRRWMETTYRTVIEEGDDGSIPYALSHLPLLEFSAGNWDRAEEAASRYLAASVEAGQDSHRLAALFTLVQVLAHQGRDAEARPLIEELLRDAEASGSLWDLSKGWTALGALELSLGQTQAAVTHLLQADEGRDRLGDEQHRRHEGDLIEALVEAGRVGEARELLPEVERRARRFRRHSRLAIAARCRALVLSADGRLDEAIEALDEALREHDLASFPFDRARTALVLGRVRRRRRERRLAKVAFESALAGFERVGARLWAQRARAELDRVGIRRSSAELTEGERRVAELVASGKTIAEAAALLFVSPRTAEANLSRVYRKLDISSRAELGAVMAASASHGDGSIGAG